jgi:predicted AlkP superfamily phosphohydrolase/phosphomutase
MKIVVIGLDSASWNVLMPFIEAGTLPTIGRLVANGVRGYLRSSVPPITFPAWKCYSTGKNPGKLGVYSFAGLDKERRDLIFHTGADFKEKEIWDYLSSHGLRSCVINMPSTYPPKTINGIIISGMPIFGSRNYATPTEIMKDLHGIGYKVEAVNYPGTRNDKQEHEQLRELISSRFEIAKIIRDKYDIDFWQVTVFYIDKIQHIYFNNERILKDYWQLIDTKIGDFLEGFGRDANVFLMSDHGATGIRNTLYINELLLKEGYLRLRTGSDKERIGAANIAIGAFRFVRGNSYLYPFFQRIRRIAPRAMRNLIRSISKRERRTWSLSRIDWEQSDFLAIGTGFGSIHRLNGQPERMQELRALLEQLHDPVTGGRVADVFARDEVYTGHMRNAPDMVVVPRSSTLITEVIRDKPEVWGPPINNWQGMHEREGMFLASGPDIRQGQEITGASLLDIAPTILHLFGIPIPRDMDGRVLSEIFSDASEAARRKVMYRQVEDERQDIRERILKLKASGIVK